MWTDRLVILTRPVFHTTLVGDCLRWTDRLDITCLGRCSCTNQVSSVSLSVLCCQRMDISPVTQKKKKKKKKNPAQPLSQAPTASLYPGQITSSLLPARGGGGGGAYAHTGAGTSGQGGVPLA